MTAMGPTPQRAQTPFPCLEFHPQGLLRCPVSGLVDQEACHMMRGAKGSGQRTMGELFLTLNFDPCLLGCSTEQAKLSLGLESPGWCWHFLRRKEEAARVDQKQASCCLSAGYPSSAGGWGGRARNPFMLVTSLGALPAPCAGWRAMVEHSAGLYWGEGDKAGAAPVSQGQSGSG